MTDMGIFRTTIGISRDFPATLIGTIENAMVDTGAEYSWVSGEMLEELGVARVKVLRFVTADGRIVERHAGYGFVHAAGEASPTILVFAEAGDQTLLGAHGLEGMNLRVDLVQKRLIPAGPVPAAAA